MARKEDVVEAVPKGLWIANGPCHVLVDAPQSRPMLPRRFTVSARDDGGARGLGARVVRFPHSEVSLPPGAMFKAGRAHQCEDKGKPRRTSMPIAAADDTARCGGTHPRKLTFTAPRHTPRDSSVNVCAFLISPSACSAANAQVAPRALAERRTHSSRTTTTGHTGAANAQSLPGKDRGGTRTARTPRRSPQ